MIKKGQVVKCNGRNALYIKPIDDQLYLHQILVGKQLKKCTWEENPEEFGGEFRSNSFEDVEFPPIRRIKPALTKNESFDYTYDESNYRFEKKD